MNTLDLEPCHIFVVIFSNKSVYLAIYVISMWMYACLNTFTHVRIKKVGVVCIVRDAQKESIALLFINMWSC